MHCVSLFVFLLALAGTMLVPGSQQTTALSEPPYPPSAVITGVSFDHETYVQRAPGSDNWPMTWADDGHQYTAFGDGGGFGGTNSDGRVSLGVARVEGEHDGFVGRNVWGGKDAENAAQFGGKTYAILSVGSRLFMWVTPGSNITGYNEARLAVSLDHGAHWTQVDWAFTKADGMIKPGFLQFCRAYAGARDAHVYAYFIRLQDDSALTVQKPGKIDLARAPEESILDRDGYEFFAGLDGQGQPTWTKTLSARQPVFEDVNGVGWSVAVSYNAGLGRYLLTTEHDASFQGNLGIFDAPDPWGPWTTVLYDRDWEGLGHLFYWNFANKWLSADGRDFSLVFTGIGDTDSWNSIRGRFSVAGPAPTGGP